MSLKPVTNPSISCQDFLNGLVFGFDLGTASLAHGVREKDEMKETGVIECPSETAALAGRRKLRNGKRVLDHRQDRRDWFAEALAPVLGLTLHENTRLPKKSWIATEKGLWKPLSKHTFNPVGLRVAALKGEALSAEDLFTALTHLVKRRGPASPPWAEVTSDKDKAKDEEENNDPDRVTPEETEKRFERAKTESSQPQNYYPCHYLALLDISKQRQRKHAWPRHLMRAEAAAILAAQAMHWPLLNQEKEIEDVTGEPLTLTTAQWLLRGNSALLERKNKDTDEVEQTFSVFYRNHRNRERAPFTFQAARIHNRQPGTDLIQPRSEDGHPNYVMSRSRQDYRAWQVEVALINFKVLDLTSRKKKKDKIRPPAKALAELREIIGRTGQLTKEDLESWAAPYKAAGQFALIEDQPGLVGKGEGRGKFGKHGLAEALRIVRKLQEDEEAQAKLAPRSTKEKSKLKTEEDKAAAFIRRAQPEHVNMTAKLRFNIKENGKQTSEPEPLPRALRRFINEIRDPVVQHRVRLFDRLLDDLIERHGEPSHIVVECVRELGDDPERAAKASQRREENRKENTLARSALKDMGFEVNDKNLRKFRLLQECRWRCPYNPDDRFMQSEFEDLVLQRLVPPTDDPRRKGYMKAARSAFMSTEVEHMVPQSAIVCDEWYNVTVTRRTTNEAKGKSTPYEFVLRDADEVTRARLIKHAADLFGESSLKYKIFTSPDARSLIDPSVHLQQTAYIARCVRYVCLLKFGWLTAEGRDPLQEKGHAVNDRYLVSNGGLTHRLRKAWKLDELLHDDRMSDEVWAALSDEEKEKLTSERRQKNRQDLRHHALDAMIVSCTLPWAANSADYVAGWCHLDPQDGSVSSVRCPIFGEKDHGQEFKRQAADKLHALKMGDPADNENHDRITHYRSNRKHAAVFDTGLYGKRTAFGGKELSEPVFVIRKALSDLTPDSLNAPRPDPILDQIKADASLAKDVGLWQQRIKEEEALLETKFQEEGGDRKLVELKNPKLVKRMDKVGAWLKQKPTNAKWGELEKFLFPSASGNVIFSPKLREHIRVAWQTYTAEPTNWFRVLNSALAAKETELAIAKSNAKNKFQTIQAKEKDIYKLKHWAANQQPDTEAWGKLQTYLHGELGARYPDCVFPRDFIETLKHPDYQTPLLRVKVTQQTKDEGSYISTRPGTYLKYKGGFKCMKVYDAPADKRKRADFISWLVRPFYPQRDGTRKKRREVEAENIPDLCRGQKLIATFRNGDVVRFKRAIPSKEVEEGTNWMLCETSAQKNGNVRLTLVPAHLALTVQDPLNPRLKLSSKDTDKLDIMLNDFMRALDYEPAHHSSA